MAVLIANGTVKADGTLVIAFPSIPMGRAFTGSVVTNAPAGSVLSPSLDNTPWGDWASPAVSGPIQAFGNQSLAIAGTGLTPTQVVTAWWIGADTPDTEVPPIWPTSAGSPTSVSNLSGAFVINVKAAPYNAKGDGVTDDTAAIQLAINIAASVITGGVVYFPPGTYIVNGLAITTSIGLLGAGTDLSTIKLANGANVSPVIVSGSVRGFCQDLTIDANKAGNALGHGIVLTTNGYQMLRSRVQNAAQNGVELSGLGNVLQDSEFVSCGGSGIRLVSNASDNLVTGCTVQANNNGIFIYDNGVAAYCYRNRIIGNLVSNNVGTSPAQAQDGGISGNGAPDTIIADNDVHDNTGRGIHVFGNSPGTIIANNRLTGNGQTNQVSGIDVGDVGDYNFLVIGNIVWTSGAAGIFVVGLQRSIISGNECINNGITSVVPQNANGITIDSVTNALPVRDNIITGNICFDSQGVPTQQYGIREWTGGAASYTNNVISENNCRTNAVGAMLLISQSSFVAKNVGYNPRGSAVTTPAVSASGVVQTNVTNVDCMVAVVSGAGAVTAITVGGTATGLTLAGGGASVPVRVPAGQTIALTYPGAAPTWAWFGD